MTRDDAEVCARWRTLGIPRPSFAEVTDLGDGTILYTGGASVESDVRAAYSTFSVVDPRRQITVASGLLKTPRISHSAGRLMNGDILLLGGLTKEDRFFQHNDNVWNLTWERISSDGSSVAVGVLPEPQSWLQMVSTREGTILFGGGMTAVNPATRKPELSETIWEFDPMSNSVRKYDQLPNGPVVGMWFEAPEGLHVLGYQVRDAKPLHNVLDKSDHTWKNAPFPPTGQPESHWSYGIRLFGKERVALIPFSRATTPATAPLLLFSSGEWKSIQWPFPGGILSAIPLPPPYKDQLVVSAADETTHVWDLTSGQLSRWNFPENPQLIADDIISIEDHYIVFAPNSLFAYLIETRTGHSVPSLQDLGRFFQDNVYSATTSNLTHFALTRQDNDAEDAVVILKYDRNNQTWDLEAPPPFSPHALTCINNEDLLAVGSVGVSVSTPPYETWGPVHNIPVDVAGADVPVVGDLEGNAFFVGSTDIYVFEISSQRWTSLPLPSSLRTSTAHRGRSASPTLLRVGEGRLLIATENQAEFLNLADRTWTTTPELVGANSAVEISSTETLVSGRNKTGTFSFLFDGLDDAPLELETPDSIEETHKFGSNSAWAFSRESQVWLFDGDTKSWRRTISLPMDISGYKVHAADDGVFLTPEGSFILDIQV